VVYLYPGNLGYGVLDRANGTHPATNFRRNSGRFNRFRLPGLVNNSLIVFEPYPVFCPGRKVKVSDSSVWLAATFLDRAEGGTAAGDPAGAALAVGRRNERGGAWL
jgi:hypothetical protein